MIIEMMAIFQNGGWNDDVNSQNTDQSVLIFSFLHEIIIEAHHVSLLKIMTC